MAQGQDFLQQLKKVNGARILNDTLILFRNNKELLRLVEQENY